MMGPSSQPCNPEGLFASALTPLDGGTRQADGIESTRRCLEMVAFRRRNRLSTPKYEQAAAANAKSRRTTRSGRSRNQPSTNGALAGPSSGVETGVLRSLGTFTPDGTISPWSHEAPVAG